MKDPHREQYGWGIWLMIGFGLLALWLRKAAAIVWRKFYTLVVDYWPVMLLITTLAAILGFIFFGELPGESP